jgi:hypothetical protein
VVDKAGNASFGGINDHVLIERHQVVALQMNRLAQYLFTQL